MKKNHKKTKLSLILLVAMAFMLFGCGNAKDETASSETVSAENETEVVEEAEPSLEPAAEETPAAQEVAEAETAEQTEQQEVQPAADETASCANIWDSVKETDDICIVVLDESMSSETLLTANGIGSEKFTPYVVKKEEKVYIPLRDNITGVLLWYCEGDDGSTTLYSTSSVGVDYPIVDMGNNVKAIEIEEPLKKDYNIIISTSDAEEHTYFLIIYDNQ